MPAQCPRRINEARSVNLVFTGRRAGPPQARPDPLGGSIAVLGERGVVMSDKPLKDAVRRKASFWQTMKAVAWSFFGVRKSADYEKDVNQLDTLHLVISGVIAAVLFIIVLVLLVNWVLASGVAK